MGYHALSYRRGEVYMRAGRDVTHYPKEHRERYREYYIQRREERGCCHLGSCSHQCHGRIHRPRHHVLEEIRGASSEPDHEIMRGVHCALVRLVEEGFHPCADLSGEAHRGADDGE